MLRSVRRVHLCVCVFVAFRTNNSYFHKQHQFIALYNWGEGFYCAVRNTIFNTTEVQLSFEKMCHGLGGYSSVSHREESGLIPGHSLWDLWWTKWHWNRFSPSTSCCQYHSINAPTCCFYLNDKLAKPARLPKSDAVSEIGEYWIEKYLTVFSLWRVSYVPEGPL
jgi:hypothetical protein